MDNNCYQAPQSNPNYKIRIEIESLSKQPRRIIQDKVFNNYRYGFGSPKQTLCLSSMVKLASNINVNRQTSYKEVEDLGMSTQVFDDSISQLSVFLSKIVSPRSPNH